MANRFRVEGKIDSLRPVKVDSDGNGLYELAYTDVDETVAARDAQAAAALVLGRAAVDTPDWTDPPAVTLVAGQPLQAALPLGVIA